MQTICFFYIFCFFALSFIVPIGHKTQVIYLGCDLEPQTFRYKYNFNLLKCGSSCCCCCCWLLLLLLFLV